MFVHFERMILETRNIFQFVRNQRPISVLRFTDSLLKQKTKSSVSHLRSGSSSLEFIGIGLWVADNLAWRANVCIVWSLNDTKFSFRGKESVRDAHRIFCTKPRRVRSRDAFCLRRSFTFSFHFVTIGGPIHAYRQDH